MGAETIPGAHGGNLSCPLSIEAKRLTTTGSSGNVGIHIDVTGATTFNNNVDSGNHALYIPSGFITGFRLRTITATGKYNLGDMDNVLLCAASSAVAVMLPTSPKDGQIYFIRKMAAGNVTIWVGDQSNHKIRTNYNSNATNVTLANGGLAILIWDNVNKLWTANYCNNM